MLYPSAVSPQETVRLGEYVLLERLGQGGMAMVYRAERTGEAGFKKKVAIKRMLPQYRRNPSLLERFAAEARTNARLDHPNLVQVVDFGIEPEPYLVMEFVDGVTLAALLQRLVDKGENLEVAAACFIGAEAAQGLDHAHRKRDEQGNPLGIVHRDVSPQNVLLSNEGAVKVSDFGLVKAADNVVQTGKDVPIGKMSYMAPEQAQNIPVDARADVFSLGVVVWEMLAMRTLMPPNNPMRVGAMLQTCDFPPPSSFNDKVSPALDRIVMSCLTRDSEQRTPSAQALSMQLREVLHEIAPGYGRDQLARLTSWAFPERGWTIDEPHETAAQPSASERLSIPQITAAEVMQRASLAHEAEAVHTVADASTRARKGSALPWILMLAVAGVLGAAFLAVLVVAFLFSEASDDASDDTAPPMQPIVQQSSAQSVWIDSDVPNARIWLGGRELGAAPVEVHVGELSGEPLVAIARHHQPLILPASHLQQSIAEGRSREQLSLFPTARPDQVVYFRWPRPATARLAYTTQELGQVPGVLLVPAPRPGVVVAPILELVENNVVTGRFSTARCVPDQLCEIAALAP